MAQVDLEARVSRLEDQVGRLQRMLSPPEDAVHRQTDLERVAGFFGDDPFMKRVMREALKYREQSRKESRRSLKKPRRSKT